MQLHLDLLHPTLIMEFILGAATDGGVVHKFLDIRLPGVQTISGTGKSSLDCNMLDANLTQKLYTNRTTDVASTTATAAVATYRSY